MKVELEIAEGFQNPNGPFDFTSEQCSTLIECVLTAGEQYLPELPENPEQEVFVYITNDSEIRKINQEHRDIDKATDVLSFPMLEHKDGIGPVDPLDLDPETGRLLLGDIIISAEHVTAQAEAYGHSVERELAFLVCHGFLHLRGFDHMVPEDERKMMDTAEAILGKLS